MEPRHRWSIGSSVYRLQNSATAQDLYLKHGMGAGADAVTDEMVRLHWLADHVPAPSIVHFIREPDEAWLLTTAISGETAYQAMGSAS